MLFWNRFSWSLAAIFVGLTLAGCSLSNESQQDDEKEPHFVLGKSRVNALDYTGAAEAFEEALEVSPHSAAAHFQLAWLFENRLSDPAAAIYHYQEYLKLDPHAGNPDVIKQHIYACKQELVKDVMQLPSTPGAQRQIDQLVKQNQQMQDELDKWRAYYVAQITARPGVSGTPVLSAPLPAGSTTSSTPGSIPPAMNGRTIPETAAKSTAQAAPPYKMRSHVVASGETLATIARKAGISLNALQAANPGLNPRHLHTGQTINLPPP